MSGPTTFGGTISGGIQDISALLPLLGTDQCERHIGSALDRGFLYCSVTPISIFGSLGIVRASVSILAASVNVERFQFLGAKALSDSGFSLSGATASMIGMDGKRFLAETRLEEMLAEERIDNVLNLTVSLTKDITWWNIRLILSTLFISLTGLAPYIIVIVKLSNTDPNHFFPLGFGFPVLRVFGSAFCVIVAQFLIQIRVLILLKTRLLFVCINRRAKEHGIEDLASVITTSYPTAVENNARADLEANDAGSEASDVKEEAINVNAEENDTWTSDLAAEKCVWALQKWLATNPKGHEHYQELANIYSSQYEKHLGLTNTRIRPWIMVLCFLLAAGCISTVVGYVGCFFLIQHSASSTGTLVWLGLEAALSVLRIIIWAVNPSWDDSKGIAFELQLSEYPPMITTHENVEDILLNHTDAPLMRQETFLEHIKPYTGPLRRFNVQDVELYYLFGSSYHIDTDHRATMHNSDSRYLLIVLFAHKEQTSRVLVKRSVGGSFEVFNCSLLPVQAGSEIRVKVEGRTSDDTHFFTRNPAFMAQLTAHHDEISFKLRMDQERLAVIGRTWAMCQPLAAIAHNKFHLAWKKKTVPMWHPLTNVEDAYLQYHILATRRRKLSSVLEDWVFTQVGNYFPLSLPPITNQTAGDSEDPDPLVSYLERWDALEKEFIQLECQRFFELFLWSYCERLDSGVDEKRLEVIKAVRQHTLKLSANDASHLSTGLEDRLTKEMMALEEETKVRKQNMVDRITAYQPVESAVDQSDLHLEQFRMAVTQLIKFANRLIRNSGEEDLTIESLPIRGDKFRSAIKDRFNPPAPSKSPSPEFAIANILTMCERRADGFFSALVSVDAALQDRELDSISINKDKLKAELRQVGKIWRDQVRTGEKWTEISATES